ncbi:MAG: septum formation initiator family protein [Halanaerobacter sp.]
MSKEFSSNTKKNLKRLITLIVLGIIVIFIFNIFLNLYQGHQKIGKLERKMDKLDQEITGLDQETKKLKERVEYINSNHSIEEIARKDLGLVKENELLYVIVEEDQ